MLLARRTPQPIPQRLRDAVWPRCGWRRAARYAWLRLTRLQGSPHVIALGVAVGIFATFLPLLGIQMALAAGLAYTLRGSLAGAVAATFVGTPITYPAMWLASYRVGGWLLRTSANQPAGDDAPLWELLASAPPGAPYPTMALVLPVAAPLIIGSIVLGLAASTLTYYSLSAVLIRVQARRRRLRAGRHVAGNLSAA